MLKVSIINFWKDTDNDHFFIEFIRKNINENLVMVPYNEHPDILLSSVCGNIYHISSIKAKVKIMFLGENLSRSSYRKWNKILKYFDMVVGFEPTRLEKNIIRFPLWLIYYPYYKWCHENNILNYIEKEYEKNKRNKKSILSTCIARQDRGNQRSFICDIIEKYKPNQSQYPSSFRQNTEQLLPGKKSKINFLKECIFNVCPENSIGSGYHTEKIMHAFEGGTIPIYWAGDRPEKDLIHENKYIFCSLHSRDEKMIKDGIDSFQQFYNGPIFTENGEYIIENYYETLSFQIKLKLGMVLKPKRIGMSFNRKVKKTNILEETIYLQCEENKLNRIKEQYRKMNDNDILVFFENEIPNDLELYIYNVSNCWKGMMEFESIQMYRKCKYVSHYFRV